MKKQDDELKKCPKDIPMIVKEIIIDKKGNINGYICPECEEGHYVLRINLHNYCPNCGQRLLWPDENND